MVQTKLNADARRDNMFTDPFKNHHTIYKLLGTKMFLAQRILCKKASCARKHLLPLHERKKSTLGIICYDPSVTLVYSESAQEV